MRWHHASPPPSQSSTPKVRTVVRCRHGYSNHTAPPPHAPTSLPDIDVILTALDAHKAVWSATPPKQRAQLLRACLTTTLTTYQEASEVACRAHGSYGSGTGEELLSWMPVVTGLREFAESLESGGQVRPHSIRTRPDGQLVVDAFPLGYVLLCTSPHPDGCVPTVYCEHTHVPPLATTLQPPRMEGMLFGGCRGEVWIMPGHAATQGSLYQRLQTAGPGKGAVALVLGAGNQLPVVMLDILHMLVLQDSVVVCKMNPVNEYLGPFVRCGGKIKGKR